MKGENVMCIFRLGFLLDRKKYFTDDTSYKKGLDVDGDIFNICHKNRYGKMVSKTFFVNIMRGEFRRLNYPQQYLTLFSKHWIKMIQKDYGMEITGEMDYYTYNAIMHVYGDEVLEIDEYDGSMEFIQEKDLRTKMHKFYMKETLSSMLNKYKEK